MLIGQRVNWLKLIGRCMLIDRSLELGGGLRELTMSNEREVRVRVSTMVRLSTCLHIYISYAWLSECVV